ncbi:hypothetical protein GGR50DRAFT_658116 [Xylaria sp. CBS 124048]|nr:hypothetical protein GGR50DRAFT_658116 [Xylaria sp. CBS 124048]
MDAMRGSSPPKSSPSADPEPLLNSFRAAALSVTKLYKTSAAVQAKARSDGYQDCLEDLVTFLDKRRIGLRDGEGLHIRKWVTARLDGGDSGPQISDDDEEVDKSEAISPSELPQTNTISQQSTMRSDPVAPVSHPPVIPESVIEEPQTITVPTQENFTFLSSVPYPQDPYLNIANLDLSDSTRTNDNSGLGSSTTLQSQPTRFRRDKRGPRPRTSTTHLGRGAGQKRTINLAELFDVGSLNFGKDAFGRDGKRSRHT